MSGVFEYLIVFVFYFQAQMALLTRFLAVGKYCYETRNFATAMQILSGLENVIVRQLPVRNETARNPFFRIVPLFPLSDKLSRIERVVTS